jgi:membrane protein DedA with SNARE-associated domain
MDLQGVVNTYGYVIVVIGTFFEGETFLIMGGIAAKLGYLKLPWVMLAAFAGSLCGDQAGFYVGRRYGPDILAKKPHWEAKTKYAQEVFHRFEIPVLLGFRFVYGLRWATPFALGMGKLVSPWKFLIFNTISAALWAIVISSLGYAIGHGAELVLGDIKQYELELVAVVAGLGLVVWIWHRVHNKTR